MSEWQRMPDCLQESNALHSVSDGRYLYISGCAEAAPSVGENGYMQIYDTQTATWREGARMPTPMWYHQSTLINGKIYVLGGESQTEKFEMYVYDITANNWTVLPFDTLGPPLSMYAAVGVGTKIYMIGGVSGHTGAVDMVRIFDTVSQTWSEAASLLRPSYNHGVALVGDKIYLFGGAFDKVQIYDIYNDTWTSGCGMIALGLHAVAAVSNKIYIIGGLYAQWRKNVMVYDTEADRFTEETPLPVANIKMFAAYANGHLYAGGGEVMEYRKALWRLEVEGGSGPQPTPKSLGITLPAGKSVQASVSANLADNAACTWATANPAVAQVSAAGLVTAAAPGETQLTVAKADEDYAETMPVRVTEAGEEPGELDSDEYFVFAKKDGKGVLHFGARQIGECDC